MVNDNYEHENDAHEPGGSLAGLLIGLLIGLCRQPDGRSGHAAGGAAIGEADKSQAL